MRTIEADQLPNEIIHAITNGRTTIIGGGLVYDYMQLQPKEKGKIDINGQKYTIQCMGLVDITEAGGKEKMLKALDLKSEQSSKFQVHKDWFNGFGKLYVYTIKSKLDGTTSEEAERETEV